MRVLLVFPNYIEEILNYFRDSFSIDLKKETHFFNVFSYESACFEEIRFLRVLFRYLYFYMNQCYCAALFEV